MGVGKTGQIIGETGVGEMGVGETGVVLCVRVHADGAFVNRSMHFFQLKRFMELFWDSYCPSCTVS